MKAIRISQPGGPEVLEMVDRDEPECGPEEILVQVQAFGINRADIVQRKGRYPAPPGVPADVPGLEYTGLVSSVGARVTSFKPGDRVLGLLGGGGYAQYVVAHQLTAIAVPAQLSPVEAAAIPEVYITAFDAMCLQGNLKSCQRVLINAVGSGVGLAAAQIAQCLNATVYGTSRNANKLSEAAKLLGDNFVPVNAESFAETILATTSGIDLFVELVGGDYLAQDIKCAAPRAKIILIGLLAGTNCDINLSMVLSRRLQITGTTLRARSLDQKINVTQSFAREMMPLFGGNKPALRPVIDKVYSADQIVEAHKHMEADNNLGKIVMTW